MNRPCVFMAALAAAGALTLAAGCGAGPSPAHNPAQSRPEQRAQLAPQQQAQLNADASLACDEVHSTHDAGQPFPTNLSAEIGRLRQSAKYRRLVQALQAGNVAEVFNQCRALKAG